MKRCPTCHQRYGDDTLQFCRVDGALLVDSSVSVESATTLELPDPHQIAEKSTRSTHLSASIAVLPFVNMSSEPQNEYFCDGMAEELINAFTKIEKLRVAARTSAFSFKGKEVDVREIGRRLNVGTVLEGSVRKAGNKLRITAQLVNVTDGYELWSERWDREMEDVFEIQDEISLAIVDVLKLKLLGEEKAVLLKRYTDNAEAYRLYLQGRFHWDSRTPEGIDRGLTYFQQAIDLDRNYALAYSGMADCYLHRGGRIGLPPQEGMPKAKAAATKALAIDDSLAEAHTSLATAYAYYDWNWPEAEKEYRRAIELNPNYTEAHHSYSHYLTAMARTEESLRESKRALELEPINVAMNVHLGWHYLQSRDYDQAIAQLLRKLNLDSNDLLSHLYLGLAYEQKGMLEEAIAELRKAVSLSELSTESLAALGHAYGVSGRSDEAQTILTQLKETSEKSYVCTYFIATVYLGLGEEDETFEWLNRAYDEREQWLIYLQVEPKLDSLRLDPRFADLVRRVGLPDGRLNF
jgi:adenylate cyclase